MQCRGYDNAHRIDKPLQTRRIGKPLCVQFPGNLAASDVIGVNDADQFNTGHDRILLGMKLPEVAYADYAHLYLLHCLPAFACPG
jgi:hypothetical protein